MLAGGIATALVHVETAAAWVRVRRRVSNRSAPSGGDTVPSRPIGKDHQS